MTLSLSQRLRKVVVPEVVGQLAVNAQVMLDNDGFATARVHYVDSYEPEESVVRVDPPPGHMVSSDAEVTLWVSKPSWMRYLPSIYQSGALTEQSDFLHRFLRVFQHLHEDVRQKAEDVHRLFHPLEAPPGFLPWLASWVALTVEPDWSEERKRRVIRKSAALYGIRGTRYALEQLIDIFVDIEPAIRENEFPFHGFRVGSSRVGVDSMVLPRVNLAHCFVVRLPVQESEIDDNELVKLHQVIQQEKPAHTMYCIQFAEQKAAWAEARFMRIGVSSRIGDGSNESAEPSEEP